MNANENRKDQIEKLAELLKQADKLAPEERAEYLVDHDVEVRARAQWVKDESYTGNNKDIYRCTNCGHWQSVKKRQSDQIMYMNACPFCEAKMIKKEEKKN